MFSYFCMNALCPWNKPCKLRVTRAISFKCDRSTHVILLLLLLLYVCEFALTLLINFVKNVRHIYFLLNSYLIIVTYLLKRFSAFGKQRFTAVFRKSRYQILSLCSYFRIHNFEFLDDSVYYDSSIYACVSKPFSFLESLR